MRRRNKQTRRTRRLKRHAQTRKQKGGAAAQLLAGANAPQPSSAPPGFTVMFGSVAATPAGPKLEQTSVQDQPTVSWDSPAIGTLYTLIAWDPDAPAKSWLHWLVVNCDGPDPSSGETVMPWAPPTPPAGTGEHRYIFGLFRQGTVLELNPPGSRGGFIPAAYAEAKSLTALAYRGIRVAAAGTIS